MSNGALSGLEVVRYLAGAPGPATSRQISEAMAISRATVYRTLNELVDAGWVIVQGSPRKFAPSWKVAGLGLSMLVHNGVREVALRSLVDLANETNTPAFLSFRDGDEVVATDVVQVVAGRVMPSTVFTRTSMVLASAGRAILACLPASETERLIAAGVPRLVENAPGGPDHVRDAVGYAREKGYAFCDGEVEPNEVSLSSAILDGAGLPVATLGLSHPGPLHDVETEFGDAIIQWARRASIELGYHALPALG